MREIYWRIQGVEGQIQGCLASALRSWGSRKLNTSLFFGRVEISILRIGRISSPEFGELRVGGFSYSGIGGFLHPLFLISSL